MILAGGALALAGSSNAGAPSELEEHELEIPGERLARRCLLLTPPASADRNRVLLLCHGLGETSSEGLGVRAFADRYGLLSCYRRLRAPPVTRTMKDAPFLTDARLRTLNDALGTAPFRGFSIACPFTPNVFRQPSTAAALDRYAGWLVDAVVPAIAKRLGRAPADLVTAIDGVSLGGYVALEVFLRRPRAFAAVGSTQGAFGVPLADAYAARFERAFGDTGPRPLRVATSEWDGGRKASERLVRELGKKGIEARLSISPGPHDQRWLREVGTLDLLFDYDRVLGRLSAGTGGA